MSPSRATWKLLRSSSGNHMHCCMNSRSSEAVRGAQPFKETAFIGISLALAGGSTNRPISTRWSDLRKSFAMQRSLMPQDTPRKPICVRLHSRLLAPQVHNSSSFGFSSTLGNLPKVFKARTPKARNHERMARAMAGVCVCVKEAEEGLNGLWYPLLPREA